MLQVQQKLYLQHSLPPTALAQTYALLGNKSEALRYLTSAYEQRDGSLLLSKSTRNSTVCTSNQPTAIFSPV
jgi:hypothetical protein